MDFETCDINRRLLWEEGIFIFVGTSGSGKTTAIMNALKNPGRYMDIGESGADLWVFPGADLSLRRVLTKNVDKSVFKKVTFFSGGLLECKALRAVLKKDITPERCQVIIVDDYIPATKEILFVRSMLRLYKRHRRLCVVFATHQLGKDKTGLALEIIDHADRVIFCRSPTNLKSLSTFARNREASVASRLAMASEFRRKEEYRLCIYDTIRGLFIPDYHAFESGERQKSIYAYGKNFV